MVDSHRHAVGAGHEVEPRLRGPAENLPHIGLAANLVPRQGVAVDVGNLRGELAHHLGLVLRDKPLNFASLLVGGGASVRTSRERLVSRDIYVDSLFANSFFFSLYFSLSSCNTTLTFICS